MIKIDKGSAEEVISEWIHRQAMHSNRYIHTSDSLPPLLPSLFTHSLTVLHTLSHTQSQYYSLIHSHTHTHTHSLPPSLPHSLTHSLTYTLTLKNSKQTKHKVSISDILYLIFRKFFFIDF